jgi:predicted nucleic acid-binding protein
MDPTQPPLIYLDTSVISHLEQEDAPDKMADTLRFWEQVKAGKYRCAISEVVTREILANTEPKRAQLLDRLNEVQLDRIQLTGEVKALAQKFVENQILTETSYDDCCHIACSIIGKCDIISSWNFKHMVKQKTIDGVKRITLMDGLKDVAIYTPAMIMQKGGEKYGTQHSEAGH